MNPRISMELHGQLLSLAAASPQLEVCGLLVGRNGRIERHIKARNVASNPAIEFEIETRVQIDAVRRARAGGPAIIGCYHSHPSGVARPSARDLAMAEHGSLWLIIGDGEMTAWLRGMTAFAPVPLTIA